MPGIEEVGVHESQNDYVQNPLLEILRRVDSLQREGEGPTIGDERDKETRSKQGSAAGYLDK